MQMHEVSVTHTRTAGSIAVSGRRAGSKTRSNRWHRPCYPRMLRRRGCIWPRRLCQWHVPYVLYIAITTECPVTADYIERRPCLSPVKPDRRKEVSAFLYTGARAWKDFSFCRERGSEVVPSASRQKKISISGSTTKIIPRISSRCLEKEIFWRFCSHRCGPRARLVCII